MFADVDECADNSDGCRCQTNLDGCEAICTNTVEGYDCSCNDGFVLHTDGETCIGRLRLKSSSCFRMSVPLIDKTNNNMPTASVSQM